MDGDIAMKDKNVSQDEPEKTDVRVPDWRHSKRLRLLAFMVGLSLSVALVLGLYFSGVFDSYPELTGTMEGEAEFMSENGEMETYHIQADFERKIVQLSLIRSGPARDGPRQNGRRLLSINQNRTLSNHTKIVVQDYNTKRKYFIVPKNDTNSTTKCIYSRLEGDMIPKDMLKHATLKTELQDGNETHSLYEVDEDTEVDVYQTQGKSGKIYEVFIKVPNSTLHLRSKEKGENFTELEALECYKYIEENDTIEESFYNSSASKQFYKVDEQMGPTINESLSQLLNESNFDKTLQGNHSSTERGNETRVRRYRRGLGWRNGGLDWWYGNWCGGNQGGYTDNPRPWCKSYCWQSSSYITSACRSCLPPKDGFDSACMEHDRYMIGSPAQPIYVWCEGTTLPTPTLPNPYPVPSSCPLAQ